MATAHGTAFRRTGLLRDQNFHQPRDLSRSSSLILPRDRPGFTPQDYYDAQFSMGEAGPPAYVVFSDLDYFQAFNDTDVQQAFHGVATGLAQLQRRVLGCCCCCCRVHECPSFGMTSLPLVR